MNLNVIRRAIFARLMGAITIGGVPVFVRQVIPTGQALPYVTDGPFFVRRVMTDSYLVSVQMDAFSGYQGKKEIDDILQQMYDLLTDTPLVSDDDDWAIIMESNPQVRVIEEEGKHFEMVSHGILTMDVRLQRVAVTV